MYLLDIKSNFCYNTYNNLKKLIFQGNIMKEKAYRSMVKTISWRVLGTLDTIVISYFITGNFIMAASIGSIEVITKIILYYFHERAWNKSNFGRTNAPDYQI
jgi:uncharacterized membrane protein